MVFKALLLSVPPPNTPRVVEPKPAFLPRATVKSPKSDAFPFVEISMYSIVLKPPSSGVAPPANTPLVGSNVGHPVLF